MPCSSASALVHDAGGASGARRGARTTGRPFGRRKLARSACWAARSSACSSASSGRSARSDRKPRGERGRTSWRGGVAARDGARARRSRAPGTTSTSSSPCSPRATSASTTPRSCCCACRPSCSPSAPSSGAPSTGWVAYSKICTHAGCSVGLFGIDNREPDTLRQLVCPCHQSVFDPLDSARPVGGPGDPLAARSSALDVDGDGFLVAAGRLRPRRRPARVERSMSEGRWANPATAGSSSATSTRS